MLQKIQLSRIRNTDLDEENAVETIIELTRSEYQNLIRVQKPKRFMDLNEATYMVADQTQKRGKSHLEKPEPEKTEKSTPTQNKQGEFWNTTKSENGKMVGEKNTNQKIKNSRLQKTTRKTVAGKTHTQQTKKTKTTKKTENALFAVTTMEHQQQITPIKTQNPGSVAQGKSTPTDNPTPAVEMEFPDGIFIALLDSQAENTYVRIWKAEKYGKK